MWPNLVLQNCSEGLGYPMRVVMEKNDLCQFICLNGSETVDW